MSAGTFDQFLVALGQSESGDNYSYVSSAGYLGYYQFGEEALKSIGFYNGDSTSALDFVGSWSALAQSYGVTSAASFLASPAAQDAAAHAWFNEIDSYLVSLHLTDYVGQTVGGIQITLSGLLAGAHLVGVPNLETFLQSNGANNPVDYYGFPVSGYLSKFAGYQTPYDASAPAQPAQPPAATPTSTPQPAFDPTVVQAIESVLRVDPSQGHTAATDLAAQLTAQLAGGTINTAGMDAAVVHAAADTASVATLAYEFFTGAAPNAGGMDYLLNPAGANPDNLNSAYYQAFGLENRYINFSVNLGSGSGAGAGLFAQNHANESLSQTLTEAYQTIFGSAPSATKVGHILNDLVPDGHGGTYARQDYFAAYGGDGVGGVGTKAAMVGWLLAEAVKADIGTYALSNDAFLHDVATGAASFGTTAGVDLVGHYAQAGFVYAGG